eukprot:TRINITY_DN19729_c0_g1_i3.p1 TRINITY_DN19729_c0_g1~~TRINITY_DN19729_c0_g1_i3.p1  ORF type:complete len:569 (-),score=79.32 TRINITY_DN19729_c0_g1_i3:93-1799(-)
MRCRGCGGSKDQDKPEGDGKEEGNPMVAAEEGPKFIPVKFKLNTSTQRSPIQLSLNPTEPTADWRHYLLGVLQTHGINPSCRPEDLDLELNGLPIRPRETLQQHGVEPLALVNVSVHQDASEHMVVAVGGADQESKSIIQAERMRFTGEFEEWKPLQTIPFANTPNRIGASAAVVGSHLCVVGGFTGSNHAIHIESLGFRADLQLPEPWVKSESVLPTPQTFSGMTSLNGCLYLCGGIDIEGSTLATVRRYVPELDAWESQADMLTPRLGTAVVTWQHRHKEYLVCIGGVDSAGRLLSSCGKMDVSTQEWTRLPELPEPRAAPSAVCYAQQIYVFGGVDVDGQPLDSGVALDRDGQSWIAMPPMSVPRGAFGLVLAGSVAVAVGGISAGSEVLGTTETLDLSRLDENAAWTAGPRLINARRHPAVAVLKVRTPDTPKKVKEAPKVEVSPPKAVPVPPKAEPTPPKDGGGAKWFAGAEPSGPLKDDRSKLAAAAPPVKATVTVPDLKNDAIVDVKSKQAPVVVETPREDGLTEEYYGELSESSDPDYEAAVRASPVSYTHLTLPTKRIV